MTKKLILGLIGVLLCAGLVGCAPAGVVAPAKLTIDAEKADPAAIEFTDDLTGLSEYLKECQLVAGDGREMSSDFIGAIEGKKFTFNHGDAVVTCEFYQFDLEAQSEIATEMLASIREKGFIKVLDKEIKAQISNSGKFVMIYVNAKDDEVQKPFTEKMNQKFIEFQGK